MPASGTYGARDGAPDSPGSSLPSYSAPSRGSSASLSPSYHGAAGGKVNVHLVLSPEGVVPSQGELKVDYFCFILNIKFVSFEWAEY